MKPKNKKNTVAGTKLDVNFCTECGSDLDDFDFKKEGQCKKDIEANWKNCMKIDKFKGDMCSKMFIVNENDEIWEENKDQDDV